MTLDLEVDESTPSRTTLRPVALSSGHGELLSCQPVLTNGHLHFRPVFRRVLRRNAHVGSKDDNFAKSWELTEVTRGTVSCVSPACCIDDSVALADDLEREKEASSSASIRSFGSTPRPRLWAYATAISLTSFDRNPGFVDLQEHPLIPIDFKRFHLHMMKCFILTPSPIVDS
ncbi:hypothetical protein BDZ89DRAFT_1138199 [Hymenopellis radicata]|nr:hypothetical protein BDZ89DRAFT_1138199 [Hymenopellis radicata]